MGKEDKKQKTSEQLQKLSRGNALEEDPSCDGSVGKDMKAWKITEG